MSEARCEGRGKLALALVADDEPEIRELLRVNLVARGFEVVEAGDGAETIDRILDAQIPFDVVVLDVMMPEIDGFDVLEFIRSRAETQLTPVILLTAKSEEQDRIRGLSLGAHDYVVKPFSVEELMLRLESMVRYRERESELVKMSFVEFVTELRNRRYFGIRLPAMIGETGGEMSMIWLRISGFASTSAEFGAAAAEELERAAGAALRSAITAHDEAFAFGGGEFAITTYETGRSAEDLAKRIEDVTADALRSVEAGSGARPMLYLASPHVGESATEFVERASTGGKGGAANRKRPVAPLPERKKSVAEIIAEKHRARRESLGKARQTRS